MRGEVLVAIMKDRLDFGLARDQHWYRIPVDRAHKWLRNAWPPRWLAFYQTNVFGHEKHAVNYYAEVLDIREAFRWQLFPDEPHDAKAQRRYYQLVIAPLQRLPQPIFSRKRRRIVFIPTTWAKFINAVVINDLYHESPLEDRLWAEFKRLQISVERQMDVEIKGHHYFLDFALYCVRGQLDIETDGDTWHADPKRIPEDNLRDNNLETAGWKLLRFNTTQIREQMQDYCLPTIAENINNMGGLESDGVGGQRIYLDPNMPTQRSLFDEP